MTSKTGWMLTLVLLIQPVRAAELQKFQIWQTEGRSSGMEIGETVLEVEKAGRGSIVRFVFIGLANACHDVTVRAWEKKIEGLRPSALVKPVNLCQVSEGRILHALSGHAAPAFGGIENDDSAITVQCENRRRVFSLGFVLDGAKERDPEFAYLDALLNLQETLRIAVWGEEQGFPVSGAEQTGQRFAALARQRKFEDDEPSWFAGSFGRFLSDYKGPVGEPTQDWHVSTPANVKLLHFTEPQAYPAAFFGGPSFSVRLRLTVDSRTGAVLNGESLDGSDIVTSIGWAAARSWLFDPATIPVDGLVPVTLSFKANCEPRN